MANVVFISRVMLTLALMLGAEGIGNAQSISSCAGVTPDAARLACFDRITRPVALDFPVTVREGLLCYRLPHVSETLERLVTARLMNPRPFNGWDSVSYFELTPAQQYEQLTIVAVFGFDEEHPSRLLRRGPGTSPGHQIGFIVSNPVDEVNAWLRRSGSRARVDSFDPPGQRGKFAGAVTVTCTRQYQ